MKIVMSVQEFLRCSDLFYNRNGKYNPEIQWIEKRERIRFLTKSGLDLGFCPGYEINLYDEESETVLEVLDETGIKYRKESPC